MAALRDRFEAKVDRSGEHHLSTGSNKADGTGKMKVDSKAIAARRVAWDLVHGALPPGTAVLACSEDRACVRIEHLSLRRTTSKRRGAPRRSRSRGGGSKVEVRRGVWKLSVSAGRFDDGSVRRVHRTVRGAHRSRVDASRLARSCLRAAPIACRWSRLMWTTPGVLGDADAVADEIEEFLTGVRPARQPERVLATVVFTDIVSSTERAASLGDRRWRELLDQLDHDTGRAVAWGRGRLVKPTGDGHLAIFDGPARAIRSRCALRAALRDRGIDLRVGVHTGEVELRGDDVAGVGVHLGQAKWLSHEPSRRTQTQGLPGAWHVFAATA
jgi:hypothetical protein